MRSAARRAAADHLKWVGQHPYEQWALAGLRLGEHAYKRGPVNHSKVMVLGWHVALFLRQATSPTAISFTRARKHRPFADLLRDVLAPVKKPAFPTRWRTETVRLLADGIDADQAFDRLPILADALEEAGCDHAEL